MEKEERELATLVSLLQNAISESSFLRQMANVWTEIGITEEQRQKRRETILLHTTSLWEEMTTEELALKTKMEASLQTNMREMSELYQQLSLPAEPVPDETKRSLFERESIVRSRVDSLNKVKFDRQKRLKRLIEMEIAMCKSLGEATKLKDIYKSEVIPSEEVLMQSRKRVEDIEFTLNERRGIYHDLCSKVQKIWEDLDEEPHGYFAAKRGDKNTPILTKDEMALMESSYATIIEEAAHLEDRAQDLRQKISSLWARLEIPQEEQLIFNEKNVGHKPRVITALESGLGRLEKMKRANLKKLVHNTRLELHKVWNKCLYGEKQRQEFVPAFIDSYTDDILGDLESELDRMSGMYRDNVIIFEKIAKRELKWASYMEYVERDNDPTRLFSARGGQLLKDQQMMKQLRKELNKIEKELKSELKQWEEDCECYFIVHDNRYLDTIDAQWEETDKQKQREKMKRQKEKEENTMIEMTYGSKPTTPIKKTLKRPAASPLTVPAKMRKVGQSPCVRPTLTNSAVVSRPPRSTRTVHTKKRLQQSKVRRILKEQNHQPSSSNTINETFISQINASLASTGTYSEFQFGLHDSPDLRSSVILKPSVIPKPSLIPKPKFSSTKQLH